MENGVEAVVAQTEKLYYSYTGYSPAGAKVEIVSDIYDRCIALAQTEEEKAGYEKSRRTLAALNGTVIWPANLVDRPLILIDKKTLVAEEKGAFYSTLPHELTHVHDFYAFARWSGSHDPKAIRRGRLFTVFYLWTEFHARKVGYCIYRTRMLEQNPISRRRQLAHILKEEMPFQLKALQDGLQTYTEKNEPLLYMYALIQFLARYSAWNDLFFRRMDKKRLPGELTGVFGRKIYDLYAYLHTHGSFEGFISSAEQLKRLANAFTVEFKEKKTLYTKEKAL